MTSKVILLNGPPGCGKDYVGKLIADRYLGRVHVDKFARVLKEATHALYGILVHGRPAPHDWFEKTKDVPNGSLFGLTPRQAYIAVSETYMKRHHGDRIFGELLVRDLKIRAAGSDFIVITDSGFRGEAEVVVDAFGAANCLMLQIHRSGCSFDGDSRNWVDLGDLGVKTRVVHNPGDEGILENLTEVLPQLGCQTTKTN
jgi:hypothetical protein